MNLSGTGVAQIWLLIRTPDQKAQGREPAVEQLEVAPELPLTSTCSLFTRPLRSKISRAAEIELRAPIADGSSKTSIMSSAALGAFIASIEPARSVISYFRGPTTSEVFVLLEYPAMSNAARILSRASPSRASRKAACLLVSFLVAISIIFQGSLLNKRAHFDL